MNRAAIFALLAGVLAAPGAHAGGQSAVVLIEASLGYQGKGGDGTLGAAVDGTGFVVDVAPETSRAPACPHAVPPGLYVLTNEHVVRSANELALTFLPGDGPGGASATVGATIIATDAHADLALLRVDAAELAERGVGPDEVPALRLWAGRPDDLLQGATVLALGNPEGLTRSVSRGVVSAPLQSLERMPFRLVQTDAAINHGNSGGPLVMAEGREVVGINTLTTDDAQGLGFAIPAARARTFLRQVLCGDGPRHAMLPLVTASVDDRLRGALAMELDEGEAVVRAVPVLGPAAGLEPLDVLLAVRGTVQPAAGGGTATRPLGTGGVPLREALFDLLPGSSATFTVRRGPRTFELAVVLGATSSNAMDSTRYLEAAGAVFEDIPAAVRFEDNFGGLGALVGAVRPGTPAHAAGLAEFDVVERLFVRDGAGPAEWAIGGLGALREALGAIDARRAGKPLSVGAVVYNLDTRRHALRLVRLAD